MDKKSNMSKSLITSCEQQEIVDVFKNARDFRSIGEKITAPIDLIIIQTSEVIEKDPIMNVSDELKSMNDKMQNVYNDIIDDDGTVMRFFKAIPVIGIIANKIDSAFESATFNIKSVESKIARIFDGFDQSYASLKSSIDMQKKLLEGIGDNIGKVNAYKDFLELKINEFKENENISEMEAEKEKYQMFLRNVEFFLGNLVVLVGNLEMAQKRLLIRLDSANKLSLAMNSSKPIFKTLLSTAVIEISGQKAIDASMKAMEAMSETIDTLSSDLTDKAIEGNMKAEKLSSKPVLSSTQFIENVAKLKNHFSEIESYREQILIETTRERESFKKAEEELKEIKVLNSKDADQLNKELNEGISN